MMAKEHASYLQSFRQTRISFICDTDEDMRQEMLKLLASSDHEPTVVCNEEELIAHADQIDLLVIATPNYLHTPTMLLWGKHNLTILVEKPAAVSMEQIHQLESLKASPDFIARVWVAMEYRYIPAISKLASLLPEIGEPKMVTIRENRYPFLKKVGNWNRERRFTGDTLVEKCCHFFDLFRFILGKDFDEEIGMKSVAQRGLNYHKEDSFLTLETPIIDGAYVLMSFKDASTVSSGLDRGKFREKLSTKV